MSAFLLILSIAVAMVAAYALVRWTTAAGATRARHRLEDALKHLFDEEYRGRRGTLSSLSGVLRLPATTVLSLVGRMQDQGLLDTNGQTFSLTPEGQRLALQVVRAHRLLERYFADEARLPIGEIHRAAERQEHALSPSDADRLSAALGHPTHDPHGDPIPTREGSVAPPAGTPATSWPANAFGRVVHLEDEPDISFAQIVASGIRVGQVVRVIEATSNRVVMTDGEHEFRLAPAVAANVFLADAKESAFPSQVIRLSDLPDDQPAEIVGLDESCQGFSRRRLMDLGFTAGTRIQPALTTFAGDPRAYQVRGTTIALRRDQAGFVLVKPEPSAA
jgi:DtxR family Mn-dependent transcriptional regulator